MTVFAIIAPSDSEEINQAVVTAFPNDYLKIAPVKHDWSKRTKARPDR
jgi:hypothetical protein